MGKKLNEILNHIQVAKMFGNENILIEDIAFDSREAKQGTLFVAIAGTQADGHDYIPKAIEKGASAVICQTMPEELPEGVAFAQVTDPSVALGLAASNFYGNPSGKLKLIGVTGTNGKTTVATTLHKLFIQLGHKAGLISTIRYIVAEKQIPASHTTPDALAIQKMLAEMVDSGCEYCFMEVSSHSIVQNRIAGLVFAGGIYTNITHDHLDYHKTFKEYLEAKKAFFDMLPANAFALANLDDKNGKVMQQNTKARKIGYALKSMADYRAKIIESHFDGTLFEFGNSEIWTVFIGEFNIYNLLSVIGTAIELGQEKDLVLKIVSGLKPADGRFEYVRSEDGKVAIVDYAHTPDALENVLSAIVMLRKGNEKIITVVGAGGDRDKAKRPKMGKVAVEKSDKVVVTSDNPRSEMPEQIIKDIIAGIDAKFKNKYLSITDRKEAIKTAIMLANPGDIILVAGKGHEYYQEIKGQRFHFDDKEVIQEYFKNQ